MGRKTPVTFKAVPFLWAAFFLFILFSSSRSYGAELETLWRYPAAGRIITVLGSSRDEIVYFLCEDRNLYAVTAGGVPLWKSYLGGKPADFLTEGPDGTVYVLLQNHSLLAVNPPERIIWESQELGPPAAVPKVDKRGIIYHFNIEGSVTALSHTGSVRWSKKYDSPPEASALSAGRGLYLWFRDTGLINYISPWGSSMWEYPVEGDPGKLISAGNLLVAVPEGTTSLTGIYSSGKPAWVTEEGPGGEKYIDVYGYGGGIFLLASTGKVFLLSKRGELKFLGALPETAERITGIEAAGDICGFGERNRFYLLENTGEVFRYPLPRAGDSAPRRIGEKLYAYGGEDWILYVFQIKGKEEPVFDSGFPVEKEKETEPDVRGLGGFQYYYLTHLINSPEETDKAEALEIIASYLASADQGNRHYLSHLFLQQLASQGVLDTEYEMGKMKNNYPQIRMAAVDLLSRYGDLETRDFLLRVIRYEHDSLAVSAEIRALGKMKSDPDGRGGEIIHRIVQSDSLSGGNDRIADAAISAITHISNYHGSIDEHSIETLFLIFKGNYSKDNRSRALAALQGVGK